MNEPEIKEIEQVWKIDPLLNGSTLKKIRYGKSRDLLQSQKQSLSIPRGANTGLFTARAS